MTTKDPVNVLDVIATSSNQKILLKDLVVEAIKYWEDFEDKEEFSLHNITDTCRELSQHYSITDAIYKIDPKTNKTVQWIEHEEVKKIAEGILDNSNYKISHHAHGYRLFKKEKTPTNNTGPISSPSKPLKPLKITLLDKSDKKYWEKLGTKLEKYLKGQISKGRTHTTFRKIQSRFRREKLTVTEVKKLCDKAGVIYKEDSNNNHLSHFIVYCS